MGNYLSCSSWVSCFYFFKNNSGGYDFPANKLRKGKKSGSGSASHANQPISEASSGALTTASPLTISGFIQMVM